MVGFHFFDVTTRLLEEAFFHPSGLYVFLDKTIGISKVDPMETLGIYNKIKQDLRVQSAPLIYQPQINVPTAVPPPPALASGGQVDYRPKRPTPTFG